MRTLVLHMGVTLDGYVAGPNGEHDWGMPPEDDELVRWKVEMLSAPSAHLMGRHTYEEMAQAWPTSTSVYAKPMNEIPKVVFSQTITEASWAKTRIATGTLVDEIASLKSEGEGELMAHGGASFARALISERVIDEYRLKLHPMARGSGLALWPETAEPLRLELIEIRRFPSRHVYHVYRPLD
jgi:dihydrofolate reductase